MLIHARVDQSPAAYRMGPSVCLQGLSSLELYPAIFSHFVLPRRTAVSAAQGVHWPHLGSLCLLSGLECCQAVSWARGRARLIFCSLSGIAVFHCLPSIALKTVASYISYVSFLVVSGGSSGVNLILRTPPWLEMEVQASEF